jgi:hypothetical protein
MLEEPHTDVSFNEPNNPQFGNPEFYRALQTRIAANQGKVQEEELDSCRAIRRAGAGCGMRVQGETDMVSPCAILGRKRRTAGSRPSM